MSSPSISIIKKLELLPDKAKEEVENFIDFLIEKKKNRKTPKAGFLKGTFEMADDFNEPLEDFQEHMK